MIEKTYYPETIPDLVLPGVNIQTQIQGGGSADTLLPDPSSEQFFPVGINVPMAGISEAGSSLLGAMQVGRNIIIDGKNNRIYFLDSNRNKLILLDGANQKITVGTGSNFTIDGVNSRQLINDGSFDRIYTGKQTGGF